MNFDTLSTKSGLAFRTGSDVDRLSSLLAARDRQIADLEAEIAHLRQAVSASQLEAQELKAARDLILRLQRQVEQATTDLHAIHSSRAWRFIQFVRRLRERLFPRGGRREWLAKKAFGLVRRLGRAFQKRAAARAAFDSPLQNASAPAPNGRALATDVAAKLAPLRKHAAAARGTVIFPSSVGWSIDLFQRPHHLARVLARDGYAVVFDCSTSYDDVDVIKQIEPGLFLFRGEPAWLADLPNLCLWTFSYNYDDRDRYPASVRVIYDWIDDLAVFPHDQGRLRQTHARALAHADVVAVVARKLLDEARHARPDAIYLPNAVEAGRFELEPDPNPARDDRALAQIIDSGRLIAGYYGALAQWFDYPLLIATAQLRSDWHFVLIGPDHDQSVAGARLSKYGNITWLGQRRYHELPGYLHLFTVATIPFRINDITIATSPLKLYEYFAAGKPVVAAPMPECVAYPEVQIANTPETFAAALDIGRQQAADPAFVQRLREIARRNTWHARVQQAFAALDAGRRPDVLRRGNAAGTLSHGAR